MGKGTDAPRTDYMPAEEFKKRRREAKQRGDKYIKASGIVLVKFDSNFDVFAANVAYELRHLMTYRSDGGQFARGVVRASGELQPIHAAYLGSATPPANGTAIRLNALFKRRKNETATNRWMMEVHFNAPDWVWADDDEPIVASEAVTHASQENGMKAVLHCAALLAHDFTGQQGDQILKMLEIADAVGYRRNWDLWYFNRGALSEFMNYMTNDKRRLEMMGKPAFEGAVHPHGEWKIFPFREMAQKFGALAQHSCDAAGPNGITLRRLLEFHHYEIAESLDFVSKQLDKLTNAATAGGPVRTGPYWPAMLDTLRRLQNTADHLYSAFK